MVLQLHKCWTLSLWRPNTEQRVWHSLFRTTRNTTQLELRF